MRRWLMLIALTAVGVFALPFRSPAPLIYRADEGWHYESVGGGDNEWRKSRATNQWQVAQEAFDQKDYSLSLKASKRVVSNWPLSDYAPRGQYLIGRCLEEMRDDEKAFDAYQKLLEKYPKVDNYQEVLRRQFDICNRFLSGQKFKLWGYFRLFTSMEKTVAMYEKLIKNGPYSDVAPLAQLNIGEAYEKQSRFLNNDEPYVMAAKSYERAADRYHDRPQIAADAIFREGLAYNKQARTAEYDQSTAGKAIDAFTDFINYYPNDTRVKQSEEFIKALKAEQARGSFEIAKYYEKKKHWKAAQVYYNEVLLQSPNSSYATDALQRLGELKKRPELSGAK